MGLVNRLLSSLFDLLLGPWASESPWPALIVSSLAAAALLVLIFHLTSNPAGMRRARNRFVARVLELLLYRHDLRVSLSACGRILAANAGYLKQFAVPMLAGAIPFVLLLAHMAAWFEWRPLKVGESATLTVRTGKGGPLDDSQIAVTLPAGFRIETDGVRVASRNEVSWRLRADQPATGAVVIQFGQQTESKSLTAATSLTRISPMRSNGGFWEQLLHPSEAPLPEGQPIARIDIGYPVRKLFLRNTEIHWLVAALVLMTAFGLAIGRLAGVTVA